MNERWETLPGHLGAAWDCLARGVARQGAARFPVLATCGRDGAPEARTVALRHADRDAAELEIYTDTGSAKPAEIAAEPRVSLHVWEPGLRLQLRLRGTVTILTGAGSRARWNALGPDQRLSYGVAPAPGTPIDAPHAYTRAPDPARFAVLVLRLSEIETVHLGEPVHSRAAFHREDGWRGVWRAP